jgi:hypothetical protein
MAATDFSHVGSALGIPSEEFEAFSNDPACTNLLNYVAVYVKAGDDVRVKCEQAEAEIARMQSTFGEFFSSPLLYLCR